jgi:hypothetical protein
MNPVCHYCGKVSEKVQGDVIYPHRTDLASKTFYRCKPCDAYVGCHPGTDKPLGRLADAQLRRCKSLVHLHFDNIWKSEKMSRSQAYTWLAQELGIKVEECHIGIFDMPMCQKAILVCLKRQYG